MRKSRRALVALATITLLLTSMGGPAAAASQSGSTGCNSGYSVALTTKTSSAQLHYHTYRSDTGTYAYRNSPTYTGSWASRSEFRVASWTVSTPATSFTSVEPKCASNPV